MNLRKSILKSLLFVCLTVPISIFSQSDTLELPFFEDWGSGSLDTNGWTVSDTNWSVNSEIGNPAPTLAFNENSLNNSYDEYIYSSVIDASEISFGDIWVSFDVMLETDSLDDSGYLVFYIGDTNKWNRIRTYWNSDGGFEWRSDSFNITNLVFGKSFKLQIRAYGETDGVDTWYVDNIHFTRTFKCKSPSNLELNYDVMGDNQYLLQFSWSMDEPVSKWIHWDDGVNNSGVGTCPDCWFAAAARWDPGYLIEYDNYQITKIKAFLNDDKYDSLTFFLWEGATIEDQIYLSLHDTVIGAEWITDQIDTLIILHAENEYWVGYKVWLDQPANYPLGIDDGPAITGYGDKISTNDGVSWDNLSDFGIDGNLNIHFYVEDTSGNEMQVGKPTSDKRDRNTNLSGYNLYQSINGEEYELFEFILWEAGDTSHSIVFDASPDTYCYQLTALWVSETDTCESAPALSKDNPDEDFVCVLLVGNDENKTGQPGRVKCYPNPFSTSTTIQYTLARAETVQITIFNNLGKQVGFIRQKQSAGKQQVVWDAKGLPSGMYYFTVRIGNSISRGKMLIVR